MWSSNCISKYILNRTESRNSTDLFILLQHYLQLKCPSDEWTYRTLYVHKMEFISTLKNAILIRATTWMNTRPPYLHPSLSPRAPQIDPFLPQPLYESQMPCTIADDSCPCPPKPSPTWAELVCCLHWVLSSLSAFPWVSPLVLANPTRPWWVCTHSASVACEYPSVLAGSSAAGDLTVPKGQGPFLATPGSEPHQSRWALGSFLSPCRPTILEACHLLGPGPLSLGSLDTSKP